MTTAQDFVAEPIPADETWTPDWLCRCGAPVDIPHNGTYWLYSVGMDAHRAKVHRHPPIKPNRRKTHR